MPGSRGTSAEREGLLSNAPSSFVTRSTNDTTAGLPMDYSTFTTRAEEFQSSGYLAKFQNGLKNSFGLLAYSRRRTAGDDPRSVSEGKADTEQNGRQTQAQSSKLGTFDGVFVPTSLNVLSVLMFLRFGFILGQSGILGMMAMLMACYLINLVTTMSVSAIATNGTVRGGGAYYMISRSLGPEFGGSMGIVFYLGLVFSAGMNAVGLVDCFVQVYGLRSGSWSQWLPDTFWYQYLWASVVLLVCMIICLAGSAIFARASNLLLVVLLIATISIPISALFVSPFSNPKLGISYTGPSYDTFVGNLKPHFTSGAAGSVIKGKEDFRDLFGILFPATGGIFAGASMSGDLKNPSRSIPRGTLYGLLTTFVLYTLVILSLGSTIARTSLNRDLDIIQDVNMSGSIILLGEFATSFFSALFGVIGAAKLLQALARDSLIPGLDVFGQGTASADEPILGIFFTYLIAQGTMLFNINQIASFVTMAFLMTFLVTNLACFLLKISSAPNFRPSFRYFSWGTALLGTFVSGATMFFVDGVYASGCIGLLIVLFAIIHYTASPKSWGDVSQALIYHSVRKYLLRLREEHVKFWRPQILLFVNDPRRSFKLIQFCNSLKKGGLFILGHVIVSQDFAGAVPEAKKQQQNWTKYIDFSKIKAFINVAISPGAEWGARNVVLSSGLGGMRPNIVCLGFYNLSEYRLERTASSAHRPDMPQSARSSTVRRKRAHDEQLKGQLPTDTNRAEKAVTPQVYVTIMEDMILRLKVNVALAFRFDELELPARHDPMLKVITSYITNAQYQPEENSKKYIDLWPIQMSADITTDTAGEEHNVHTTNFDTYTLILQLGCILSTVPSWKRAYTLRVALFVEYETDVEEERGRVETLLSNLRIEAEVLVFWLADGSLSSYEFIVNGDETVDDNIMNQVERTLEDDEWWYEIKRIRDERASGSGSRAQTTAAQSDAMSIISGRSSNLARFERFGRLLRRRRSSRSTLSHLARFGIKPTMQVTRLDPDLLERTTVGGDLDGNEDIHMSSESSDEESLASSEAAASASDGESSAASENDLQRYEFHDENASVASSQINYQRRRTLPSISPAASLYASESESPTRSRPSSRLSARMRTSFVGDLGMSNDSSSTGREEPDRMEKKMSSKASSSQQKDSRRAKNESDTSTPSRPSTQRHKSHPRLTSAVMPRTTVASEETAGPSIMFSTPSPPPRRASRTLHSIYQRQDRSENSPFPTMRSESTHSAVSSAAHSTVASSQDLSFNVLPSRAQHLILNELIKHHSGTSDAGDTAVIFTTLPAPLPGTCESEEDSLRYLVDLETLCTGLPPVLMIHSNSMSVTMNL